MARGFLLKNNLTKETLLKIAAEGILLLPAFTSPYFLRHVVKKYFKEKNKERVRRIRDLEKKKIINIDHLRDGSVKITLTQFGKKIVHQYKLEEMKIKCPKKWDGQWRIVIYDIPVRFKKASNVFSKKIRELGLYQIQKSMWVYPYDFIPELEFLCAVFQIPMNDCVYFFKTKELPKEKEIRDFFSL